MSKQSQTIQYLLVCDTDYPCKKCSQDDTARCTQCTFPTNQMSQLTGDNLQHCSKQKMFQIQFPLDAILPLIPKMASLSNNLYWHAMKGLLIL
ncbi:UNKNOWN [Stylonychia lemnae]|uniref:Uncharacterized protein n=1 Tax=Stylonychia lemnae TaxID=5949 RepID=A0A077ZRU0_STYLE|nr:UNKNOWN [Stylonychia lemnae]|eukprot:CDW72070.1 UNKNOWN [Stylonychia lemnae]